MTTETISIIHANHDLAQTECEACAANVSAGPPASYLGAVCWSCEEPLMPPTHHAALDLMNRNGRDLFNAEAAVILARYPDPGDIDARRTALAALVDYILEQTDIDAAGQRRAETQQAARLASIAAQQVARLAVLDGMSEVEAARRAQLDRMTVRRALGK